MQLEQRRDARVELRRDLYNLEKEIHTLEASCRRLNKKFANIVSQMKED